MKALLFAAGLGTRLKPFTDYHPKALAVVNGMPLLGRNLLYLKNAGITEVVINLHHFGSQIRDYVSQNGDFGLKIHFSDESAELLETGGGLLFAAHFFQDVEHFLVMNADILTDLDLQPFIQYHQNGNQLATLAVSERNSSRRFLFDEKMKLQGWENTATGEVIKTETSAILQPLAFSGIHCLRREILSKIRQRGKFSLVEAYLDLMQCETLCGYRHNARLIDVGKPEALLEAEKYFK